MDRLHLPLIHGARDRGARNQVGAILGKDDGVAHGADVMAGASHALHAAGDRRRRLNLDDQINRAHVNAEFERRSCDDTAQGAQLELVLDLLALRDRDAAVMGAHQLFAREFVDRAGNPFGQPPAVHEDQSRAMSPNQFQKLGMNRAPDGVALRALRRRPARQGIDLVEARHVFDRNLDAQVQPLRRAGIHNRDRPIHRRKRGDSNSASASSGTSGS